MKTAPLFTVATITYNSSKWIGEAIESILNSTFTDFELIISDDCSTDNTWAIIESYTDPRIKRFRHETNKGEYANRNLVLQMANGKYIIYVDGDDMLYPNTLRNLSEYIAAWPQAVSIWGVWSHQMQFCYFPVLLPPLETMKWIYAANLPISVMGFGETCFKTDELKAVGGFSETFISGDTYIKKRLALKGPVLLVPIGFVFWRKTEGQATNRLNKELNGYRNNVLIDRAILENSFFEQFPEEKDLFEHNCKVRDIKILMRHTLLKAKPFLCLRMMRELKLSISDLKYLFRKADFSYLDKIIQRLYKGDIAHNI